MRWALLWISLLGITAAAANTGTVASVDAASPPGDPHAPLLLPGPPGSLTTVHVPGKTSASYELCLPPNYATNRRCPLVIAFSPTGDGRGLANLLRAPCAKLGWAVAGCNVFRNLVTPQPELMASEVFQDLRRRVPHDRRREYLAGISGGGARSFWLSRWSWDQFAGIISMGGWLATYSDEFVYPARLAVALLNGDHDTGANESAIKDIQILNRFGAHTQYFSFRGGHVPPTEECLNRALAWLDADWHERWQETPLMRHGEQDAARILAEARAALAAGRDRVAAQNALQILLHYAFTPAADEIDDVLAGFIHDPARREAAFREPLEGIDARVQEIVHFRACGTAAFPPVLRLTRWELARALDPDSADAAITLAEFLAADAASYRLHRARVDALVADALRLRPEWWWVWHIRARLANLGGALDRACDDESKALALAEGDDRGQCEKALADYRALQTKRIDVIGTNVVQGRP